jgi:hypothetical protein
MITFDEIELSEKYDREANPIKQIKQIKQLETVRDMLNRSLSHEI